MHLYYKEKTYGNKRHCLLACKAKKLPTRTLATLITASEARLITASKARLMTSSEARLITNKNLMYLCKQHTR